MKSAIQTPTKTSFDWPVPSRDVAELVQQVNRRRELEEFHDRLGTYENWMDEVLTDFADALEPVRSTSAGEFPEGWRTKLLKVAQELYRVPRWISRVEFPDEYKSLEDVL